MGRVDWRRVTSENAGPSSAGGTLFWDPISQSIMLFGGARLDPATGLPTATDETWKWDGRRWTRLSPQSSPSPRAGAHVTAGGAFLQPVLFGGSEAVPPGGFRPADDTWVWDGANWILQAPTSSPPRLTGASFASSDVLGQSILFGGFVGSVAMAETWSLGRVGLAPAEFAPESVRQKLGRFLRGAERPADPDRG